MYVTYMSHVWHMFAYGHMQIMLLHQDGEVTVNDVQPLREQEVTGVITNLAHGYGTIDQDIHFTLSACPRGYQPIRGNKVKVQCVEYKHHKNNWRAYRVEPVSGTEHKDSPSSIPPVTSSFPRPVVPLLPTSGKTWVCPNINTSTTSIDEQLQLAELALVQPPNRTPVVSETKGTYQEKLAACRLPGQRPLRVGTVKLSNKLKGYPIPEELRECMEGEIQGDIMCVEPTLEQVCTEGV